MKNFLNKEEREALIHEQKTERDRYAVDRIRSILLRDRGWSTIAIAEALFIHHTTVDRYLREWEETRKKRHNGRGGSVSHLNAEQTAALVCHLQEKCYRSAKEVVAHVAKTYGIFYSITGMTDWLQRAGFVHKKPKKVPYKADPAAQQAFVEAYQTIVAEAAKNQEPVLFVDSTHPSQETVVTYGWIKKGTDKHIPSHGGRKRMNICGAINLATMDLLTRDYDTINQDSFLDFLAHIRAAYPATVALNLILDQAGYHIATRVREYAKKHRIYLHYLPPHSPNLNAIERLWKHMKETVIYNTFYERYSLFKNAIQRYFAVTYQDLKNTLSATITDTFRVITQVL